MDSSITPSLKKNYLYNLIYTLFNTALPLVTAPYLARTIGVEGTGKYAYCYSVAHFFFIFAKLGLANYGTREVSKARQSGTVSKVFSEIYVQQVIVAIVVNAFYAFYCIVILRGSLDQVFALILWTIVLGGGLDIDWLFSGLEQFRLISVRNSIVKVCTVVCIFLFVNSRNDLWKYILFMGLGFLLGNISMWISIRRFVKFVKPHLRDVFGHFLPNFLLVIPVLAMSMYRYMDKIMLGTLAGMFDTGLYENAEKVIYALCGFINAFGTVMMPRMTRIIGSGDDKKGIQYIVASMQFMMSLMFGMAFGMLSVSSELVNILFGSEFLGSGMLMAVLVFTLPAIGWSNVIRTQYVVPTGQDKIYIYTVTFGAVVNLAINWICIPRFGAMGAVIGTIFAEYGVVFMQFILLRKKIPYRILLKKVIFAPVCGLIMFAIIEQFAKLDVAAPIVMTIQVFVGILVYATTLFIYALIFEQKIANSLLRGIKKH